MIEAPLYLRINDFETRHDAIMTYVYQVFTSCQKLFFNACCSLVEKAPETVPAEQAPALPFILNHGSRSDVEEVKEQINRQNAQLKAQEQAQKTQSAHPQQYPQQQYPQQQYPQPQYTQPQQDAGLFPQPPQNPGVYMPQAYNSQDGNAYYQPQPAYVPQIPTVPQNPTAPYYQTQPVYAPQEPIPPYQPQPQPVMFAAQEPAPQPSVPAEAINVPSIQ